MDLTDIRRLVIVALFSDDVLFKQLTLKGGNALNLVYELGSRSSLDVDLSLEEDFDNVGDSQQRIFRALKDRFAEVGFRVFDEKFSRRPQQVPPGKERWGGYQVNFKLMEATKYDALKGDVARIRREALVTGVGDRRVFEIQISKHEYCGGKVETDFQDYSIVVYTPQMIVIEKLRALCQQMEEYPLRGHRAPRARDFYDIHSTITGLNIELGSDENKELARNIFAAKEVSPSLLAMIPRYREYHRQDWPSVELTVSGPLKMFDYYFDFVIEQTRLLEALWKE